VIAFGLPSLLANARRRSCTVEPVNDILKQSASENVEQLASVIDLT
jgi:hypothetical protein